jgi:hypothetical protein
MGVSVKAEWLKDLPERRSARKQQERAQSKEAASTKSGKPETRAADRSANR